MRTIFLLLLCCTSSFVTCGQDSLQQAAPDTAAGKNHFHSPLKAAIYSAVLPGAGQVYNKKYWKLPILYAGLATAGYFIYYNGNVFFTVKDNLDSRVAGDTNPQPQYLVLNNIFSKTTIDLNTFSYDDLVLIQEEYRKYFTISIIAGAIVYSLNIIDAVVDAHLFDFDVSDNLTFRWQPVMIPSNGIPAAAGISLSLALK